MINFFFTQTPLKFIVQSFWRDEAFTYLLAKKNLIDIVFLTAKDFNPPLYYFLIHFWMNIFGPSEISLRLLSLVFFWGIIYVIYLFLTNLFGFKLKKTFFYLMLFIINPILNYYAFEARMYTMFCFFSLLSYYFYFKRNKKCYIITSVLGLYIHYFMILVIINQLIYSFFFENFKKRCLFFAKQYLKIILYFLPWVIFVLSQKNIINEEFWLIKPKIVDFLLIPIRIYTGLEFVFDYSQIVVILFSLLLFLIFIMGIINLKTKNSIKKSLFYYLLLWSLISPLIVLIFSFFKPLFLARYLIFSSVGLILLQIYLFEQMNRRTRYIFIFLLIIFTLHYNQLQFKYRNKADIKKVVHEIKKMMKKNDKLYVLSELNFHPAEYYLDEERVFIYGKTYSKIPQYVGKILISDKKIITSLPVYPNKAFVLKDDLTYDIQAKF